MLQNIRDRAQGWVAGVIVALIVIPLALWGVNSYIDAANTVVVAEVDGDEIDLVQYQDALQQFRRRVQEAAGENFDLASLDPAALRSEALDALINEKLIDLYGQKHGLRISDDQLAAQIAAMEEFKQDGTFSRALYEQRVRAAGMTPSDFEQRVRHDMLREQLRQGLSDSAFATELDYARYARLFNQSRSFAYAMVPAAPFREAAAPDEAAIQAFYERQPELFTAPEAVRVAYVDLSVAALAEQLSAEAAAVKRYYQDNLASYTLPEQRRGEYVLVPVPEQADAQTVAEAEAKARDFLTQLQAGVAFTELDGLASGEPGGPQIEVGESGLVQRGMLPAALEDALFALEMEQLSGLVQTEYGFHVVRLTEVSPGGTRPLEAVREEVEAAYLRDRAERLFFEQAEELQNLAFEYPDSLEPVAETLGLEVQESAFLTRQGGPGVLAEQDLIEAAFSDDVVRMGVNSLPVELDDNRLVVVRLLEHRPAALRPLEEVRGDIEARLVAEEGRTGAAERGAALLQRLADGEPREGLAEAETLEWFNVADITRADTSVPRAILRKAFRRGRGSAKAPLYDGVSLANGDFALVAVLDVSDGDPANVQTEDAEVAREGLATLYGTQSWQDFLAEIRSEADIKTYPEQLERL